jgi:hypothetical protein
VKCDIYMLTKPNSIGMIGTLTAFQWLIYDSFKVYLGVSLFIFISRLLPRVSSYFYLLFETSVTNKHYSSPPPAATNRIEPFDYRTRRHDNTREETLPVKYS